MDKVWEAQIFSTGVVLFLIISLIVILYCACFLIKSRAVSASRKHKIVCGIIIAVLAIINLQNINDRYREFQYANRNAMIVEGHVENLQCDTNGADSFSVNDIYFSYPTMESSIGYDIPNREKGSMIKHDGQYVTITYYSKNGVNIITKIATTINDAPSSNNNFIK